MGLPWRFISLRAGMVIFVVSEARRGDLALPGKLVMLMVVSSAAPKTQDATRTRRVYAGGRGRTQPLWSVSRPASDSGGGQMLAVEGGIAAH